jgi:MOSC domain-containing protein YiiM
MSAYVLSVSSKSEPGVPKLVRDEVMLVANHGVEGDYHAGVKIRHRSRVAKDPDQANLRQVHFMHSELFDELQEQGIAVKPGQMGENITTRGLALLDLAPGALLRLGASAVVEITGCRNPCAQLNAIDERLLSRVVETLDDGSIVRRAGVMGVVLKGGPVRAGDPIVVEAPSAAQPGRALEPV